MHQRYLNLAFYRFVGLPAPGTGDEAGLPGLRAELRRYLADKPLRGTILLSPEGINGFMAGPEPEARGLLAHLRAFPPFSGLRAKESWSSDFPFNRTLVKIKREIIPMGRPDIRPHEETGRAIPAAELRRWLDERREILLLDTRNEYEIRHGTFETASSLGLSTFRQFPRKLRELPPEARDKPLVMFCTGGIRCEKATALALKEGFREVYQLEGGILRYFEEVGGVHYRGRCFVFDNRVAVDSSLAEQESGYRGASPWRASAGGGEDPSVEGPSVVGPSVVDPSVTAP